MPLYVGQTRLGAAYLGSVSIRSLRAGSSDSALGGGTVIPPPANTVLISNSTEFETYLAEGKANPASKDGDEVVFAADLEINIQGTGWQGGFNATPNKRIWRSLDPTRPAVIKSTMSIRSTSFGDDAPLGNMEIRDIVFDKTDAVALLDPELDNDQTDELCILVAESSAGNSITGFEFKGLSFKGPYPDYSVDNRDAAKQVIGIQYYGWVDLLVEGCTWDGMSTGVQIGGHDLKMGRCSFKGNAEDFIRLSVSAFNTTGTVEYDWTEDVVIVDCIFGDPDSRNRLHPDLVQFDEGYAGQPPPGLGIRRMTFRGLISYEGSGLDRPIYPTARNSGLLAGGKGMFGRNSGRVVTVWPAVPTIGIVYRLTDTTGGTYVMPNPTLYDDEDRFAFQLEAGDVTFNTWTIQPPVGVTLSVNQVSSSVTGFDLVKKNMTVEFEKISDTEWQLVPKLPNNNMYQSNMTGSDGSFEDIAFQYVAHVTQGSIGIRAAVNWRNVLIENCLLARSLPGDRTGNGIANEFQDGAFGQGQNPSIVCKDATNVIVRNCIAGAINSENGLGSNITVQNNQQILYGDLTDMVARYPAMTVSGDGYAQFPTHETEVVSLFRPGASSDVELAQQGPFRNLAANDPYSFDWVATLTVGPGQTNTNVDYSQATYPTAA